MTIEQIDRLVREANPVPNLKALEPVDLSDLRFTQQRSEDMQTQDKIDLDREPEPRNRGLLIGVAAAVVLVLIGALIYFQSREEAPVVTQAPESEAAVEIATTFVEALTTFDIERMTSLLTPSALAEGWDSADGLRRETLFAQAHGQKYLLDSCQEAGSSPSGATVRCAYAYHAIRSDEIGLGPFGDNYFDLTVKDGKVVSISADNAFMSNGFSSQVWMPFAQWVASVHPEDAAVMYTDSSRTMQAITDESIELWEQRSKEWVEVIKTNAEGPPATEIATGFVAAYAGFDTEGAASYLAENALVTLFQNAGEDWQTGTRFMETIGLQLLPGQCDEVSISPTRATVRCPFDYHNLGSDEIGLGPFTDSSITVTVEAGEIVSAVMIFEFRGNGFDSQMWQPFSAWIRENHPEDVPIMYEDGENQTTESHSEESAALWAERIAEYVEVVGQTSP